MSKQTIITLSGQAQHGKDSSAQIIKEFLEENNKTVLIINYADYLKYLAKQYFGWDGEKDEKGRSLLQWLGTEKIRSKHPDFWVDVVINIAKVFEDEHEYVLIADCRFPNEIHRWKEYGYPIISVHVERLGFDNGLTEEQKSHTSETALDDYMFDVYLKATNLTELREEAKKVFGVLDIQGQDKL